MNTHILYDSDIPAWTRQTAELLKQRRFQDSDVEHLIEELESIGRRDRQETISRLKVLLGHLLKWQYQPEHRCGSWRGSLLEQRLRILDLLQDCPRLKPCLPEVVVAAYADGARLASKEIGLSRDPFPERAPYALDVLSDDDRFPMEPSVAREVTGRPARSSASSASLLAAGESGLAGVAFPGNRPFSIEQMLDEG